MLAGDQTKTHSYTISWWWESETEGRDRQLGNPVASWIGQNTRVLDKKRSPEVVKLIVEQFPYLMEVEARHAQQQHAKWKK